MNVKTIYPSAAFSRREEIKTYAARIERETGYTIIARWLREDFTSTDAESTEAHLVEAAQVDWEDEHAATTYVRFTDKAYFEEPFVPPSMLSCARMTEFGIALERCMRIIVVGGRQNVFDRLLQVEHVADVDALIALLNQE